MLVHEYRCKHTHTHTSKNCAIKLLMIGYDSISFVTSLQLREVGLYEVTTLPQVFIDPHDVAKNER